MKGIVRANPGEPEALGVSQLVIDSFAIPRFKSRPLCHLVQKPLASNQSRNISTRHTARPTPPPQWKLLPRFGVSGLRVGSKIAIAENTRGFSAHPAGFDRQAHRNRIQHLGGNANSRTIPNDQAQSSPITFRNELAAW